MEESIKAFSLLTDKGIDFSATEMSGTTLEFGKLTLLMVDRYKWEGPNAIQAYVDAWPMSDFAVSTPHLGEEEDDGSSVN